MCGSCGGDSEASSPLSFLALPPWILAAEPFDWAMRWRGHQAVYSARSREHTNGRWNKFIIDADSEAFAGMSEHEAKGFWTSGAGHGATAEQINKHDDREKYGPMGNTCSSQTIVGLPWSILMEKIEEKMDLYSPQCAKNKALNWCVNSENLMGSRISGTKGHVLGTALQEDFFWLFWLSRKKSRCTWRRTPRPLYPPRWHNLIRVAISQTSVKVMLGIVSAAPPAQAEATVSKTWGQHWNTISPHVHKHTWWQSNSVQ